MSRSTLKLCIAGKPLKLQAWMRRRYRGSHASHNALEYRRMLVYAGVLALNIVMPCALLAWLGRSRAESRLYLATIAALSALVLVVLTFSILGAWYVIGTFWPWIFGMALIVILIYRARRRRPGSWVPRRWSREFFLAAMNVLLIGLFGTFVPPLLRGAATPGNAVALASPLRGERYYVMGGGANWSVNHHSFVPELRYALDIVQVNGLGFRAPSLVPSQVEVPYIYGAEIVAPCAGEIIGARDGFPDQPLLEPDVENRSGNHVVIYCEGHSVLMAHMRPGSVAVMVGDYVAQGHPIGQVGNSGSTTEPHLHIHAVVGKHVDGVGTASPLLINGTFLVKGQLLPR